MKPGQIHITLVISPLRSLMTDQVVRWNAAAGVRSICWKSCTAESNILIEIPLLWDMSTIWKRSLFCVTLSKGRDICWKSCTAESNILIEMTRRIHYSLHTIYEFGSQDISRSAIELCIKIMSLLFVPFLCHLPIPKSGNLLELDQGRDLGFKYQKM